MNLNVFSRNFHAFMWAVIPGFLSTANMQFGYALHKKKLMVMTSFVGMVVLVASAYVLIFGKLGLPALGVVGLAHATFLQYTFFFVVTTSYYYLEPGFKKYELFRFRVHQHLDHFIKMIKIGWPISVQMGGEMLSFFVSGIMMGWLGVNALAAFQIVNQYYFLIIIPVFSLSQASGILVGQAMGSKQFHEVAVLSKVTLLTVLGVSSLIAILFMGFPVRLASAYLDVANPLNALTLHYTVMIFMIIAVSQCFDNVRNALIGILRGMFDTRFAMFVSVFSIWVFGMPLTYFLAFTLHLGVPGFVMGGLLGMLVGVVMMFFRWRVVSARVVDCMSLS
jgi:MATE family multidrug resistance protein